MVEGFCFEYLSNQLSKDYIIPSPLDKSVTKVVAKAVSDCWLKNNK